VRRGRLCRSYSPLLCVAGHAALPPSLAGDVLAFLRLLDGTWTFSTAPFVRRCRRRTVPAGMDGRLPSGQEDRCDYMRAGRRATTHYVKAGQARHCRLSTNTVPSAFLLIFLPNGQLGVGGVRAGGADAIPATAGGVLTKRASISPARHSLLLGAVRCCCLALPATLPLCLHRLPPPSHRGVCLRTNTRCAPISYAATYLSLLFLIYAV